MTENILKALSHSLVCTEIDYLIVNLNNHSVSCSLSRKKIFLYDFPLFLLVGPRL